jgi:DNA polymerase (family 10)
MRRGLKLSEYGIFDRQGKRLGGASEAEVYRAVGLPWIPPELREGAGELEAADQGRLPRLIEEKDVRGDLHVHSDASSDAHSSLEELPPITRSPGRSVWTSPRRASTRSPSSAPPCRERMAPAC